MPMAGHGGPLPITGSHEPAGVVGGLGPGAEKFKVGDRVMAVNTARGCGEYSLYCLAESQTWSVRTDLRSDLQNRVPTASDTINGTQSIATFLRRKTLIARHISAPTYRPSELAAEMAYI